MKVKLVKRILTLKDFKKKYILKGDTMSEIDLNKVKNFLIYHRASIKPTNKGFVNIDKGEQWGTNWIFLYKS